MMKTDVLDEVVEKVVSAGADEFEVESNDGEQTVVAFGGPKGVLIASFDSLSNEGQELRSTLDSAAQKKNLTLEINQVSYVLHVTIFDSLDEDAYRVTLRKM